LAAYKKSGYRVSRSTTKNCHQLLSQERKPPTNHNTIAKTRAILSYYGEKNEKNKRSEEVKKSRSKSSLPFCYRSVISIFDRDDMPFFFLLDFLAIIRKYF